jgi:YhcH/YjgK/YiaL family protein
MIIDNINNAHFYYGLGPRMQEALKYLEETDLSSLPPGMHEIKGKEIYAIVQDGSPRRLEDAVWEAHNRYSDVQFIASGQERMGYANMETMKSMEITDEYDEEKDIIKFRGEGDFFLAEAGTFVIFMPQDAHMPSIALADPAQERVRKVVVKVLA